MLDKRKEKPAIFLRPVAGDNSLNQYEELRGLSNYYILQQDVLFWHYKLDALQITIRRIGVIIQRLIDAILFLLIIVNALILFKIGTIVEFDSIQWLELIFISYSPWAAWFWILAIFNLYLYYRVFKKSVQSSRTIFARKETDHKVRRLNIADSLSKDIIEILDSTWSMIQQTGQYPIRPMQLFYGLLRNQDVRIVLARLGIPYKRISDVLQRQIAYYPPVKTEELFSKEVEDVFLNAYLSAIDDRNETIRVTDVMSALIKSDESIQEMLYDQNVEINKVQNVLRWVNFNNELVKRYQRYRAKSVYKPKGPINRSYTAAATPFLDSYSHDLTQAARRGAMSLSVARDKEIEELFRITDGGKSVILVGENGVGKFNIIEGLANSMVAEEVPPIFKDKRLVNISLAFLVAGAAGTGEVEERLLMVLQEVKRSGNIILVIEDAHNLVGVSSAGTEGIDLSEVLAQEVQNQGVWVIATTTPADYAEFIERSALGGTLESIKIVEPEKNQAIQILEANVGSVEAKNKVFFTYESLEEIVNLSDRYLHDQFLPAKGINLMNEVGSWVSKRESKLITGEDIAALVSKKTNIPLTKVTEQESNVLMNLDEIMHRRIVGQDDAVKLVVSALRRARAELRDEKRPIANMLFLGPTGVGKTELAKTVAESYFGDENAMIRIDMSEYQSQDSISRMIGMPGSGRGGILTEKVRNNPFSLLLLDEIEKAHSDILNLFLQVMDDGRLTDSMGRTVDFTNVILVATSNAQANYIQDEVKKNTPIMEIKDRLVRERLRDQFRPEFLNRFDGIVVFKPLTKEEIFQIAGLLLKSVEKRLEEKGISLEVTPSAQQELADAGFDPIFGARPLRRVIQERVEESLSNYLLKGEIGRRDVVVLDVGGKISIRKAKKL